MYYHFDAKKILTCVKVGEQGIMQQYLQNYKNILRESKKCASGHKEIFLCTRQVPDFGGVSLDTDPNFS